MHQAPPPLCGSTKWGGAQNGVAQNGGAQSGVHKVGIHKVGFTKGFSRSRFASLDALQFNKAEL